MLRTISSSLLTHDSSFRDRWIVGLILGFALICPAWTQVVVGPANQDWASVDSPVQIPAALYDYRISFDPFSDSSVPAAYRASRVRVDLGSATVSTAGTVNVTLSKQSPSMITTIRVEVWDTRNGQAHGVRLFYFYRNNPLITMAEPMESWGSVNRFFTNVVTSHAYYSRADGSLVYIINRNPVVLDYEIVSQPGPVSVFSKQCDPYYSLRNCKTLLIYPQATGDYVIRFRLKNNHPSTPNSEGYWITWTHHVRPYQPPY